MIQPSAEAREAAGVLAEVGPEQTGRAGVPLFFREREKRPEALRSGAGASLASQQVLAAGMLRPAHLMDLVRNFTAFKQVDGRTRKVVARYQQFRAVHKAVDRLESGRSKLAGAERDERGGIIWHTQGSGKSLSMVFLVRKMRTRERLKRFKVVVVTDRTDLEDQLRGTAALTGEAVRPTDSTATILGVAIEYARLGWQVFPCHPTGHQPLVKGGFYAATTDAETIRSWWTRWSEAAIGLRTGQESGVFAVDIDPRNGGDVSLEMLEDAHSSLPETVESQTGGGGRHLLFVWPGQPVPCSVGKIGAGIDIKGDGGYIILPPSDHESGRQYAWLFDQAPGECEIAEAPAWLMERIERDASAGPATSGGEPVAGEEIPRGYRNKTLASQAGHMRQIGMTSDEIAPALQAINLHRCKPPLDAAEVQRIAASIGRYDPDSCRQAGVECWPERFLGDGTDWPDPKPLPEDLPPVKAFNPTLLPSTLRPWIVDIAERMQCPPDFPAVASMVALSGILGRKITIRPKQMDDWTVYANLWGMEIGRPSLMKSPPMKETLLPIRRMTAEALVEYEEEVTEHLANEELCSIKIKLTRDRIAKTIKDGGDTEGLQAELAGYLNPKPPSRKRYTVNDVTVEALGEILSANPNGVIIERDELMGFLKSLERPGQEGARAFYLEGWTGDGSFETDRIGRGNVRINGVCLSILGTIQPGPLGMYLNETLRGGTGDDGLMQRFQMAVWPDDPGPWRVVDRWPDSAARDVAYQVYRRFDELPAAEVGELPGAFESNDRPFLRFDPAAQERFYDWMTTRENRLRSGTEHPAIESHLAKYRKLIPALALVTHLAEGRTGPVGLDALERAIGWGDYLESHARRIYSCGIDPAVAHARALVRRIQQGDVADGFTLRDVYHGRHWSMLADAAQVQLAVNELVELGWLRVQDVLTSGRPAKRHRINPKALAMIS